MTRWLRESPDGKPPLVGRLIGLTIAILALWLALHLALDVVAAIVPLLITIAPLFIIYAVIVGKFRR
jgi:hypothetical protein